MSEGAVARWSVPIPEGASYGIRIETLPGAGARYYWRPSGIGAAYTLVFDSPNETDAEFSFGADVNRGVFGFDDIRVTESVSDEIAWSTALDPNGEATLVVTDHALQSHSTNIVINVITGAPPTATLTGPTNGNIGIGLTFDAGGSSDDFGIAGYFWDFGDGSGQAGGPNISHFFTVAGVYTVTVQVVDYSGQTAAADLVVTIGGEPLVLSVPWRFTT